MRKHHNKDESIPRKAANNTVNEFEWIGYPHAANTNILVKPTQNASTEIYSTIKSTKSAKVSVSKKGWKKRFGGNRKASKKIVEKNNNRIIEDYPDFKIYEAPDFKIYDDFNHFLPPKTTPIKEKESTIVTTPIPPIPARKRQRNLFNNDIDNHDYFEISPLIERRPKMGTGLRLAVHNNKIRRFESLQWEADLMYSHSLVV